MNWTYDFLQAAYLDMMHHPTHGFALLGCVFSLPKAILYWSALLAIGQGTFITFSSLHTITSYAAFTLVAALAFSVLTSEYFSYVKEYAKRAFSSRFQDTTQPSIDGRV